jgi:opacity protein-like surface antigen
MNKILMIGAAALAVAALSAPANAEGTYVELNGGPAFSSASGQATGAGSAHLGLSNGYNVGGGFGTSLAFFPEITLGAQAFYTSQDAKNTTGLNNSTLSLMGVANYHLPIGPLDLYAGGGLGVLEKELSVSASGTTATLANRQFGYQLQAGAQFPVSDSVSLFGEYRYQGSTSWKINYPSGAGLPAGNLSFNEQSHNLTFGVRLGL